MRFGTTWITAHSEGLVLTLRVVPRASKTEVCGEINGALKIRLQAPPVDGKANNALIRFLAERLDVAPSRIEILGSRTGRNKRVRITGIGIPQALASLLPMGQEAGARCQVLGWQDKSLKRNTFRPET